QIASNSSPWTGAIGSASIPTICCFMVAGMIDAVTCVSAITGHGMFGVGGATGLGIAANSGYHGMPGTLIVAVYDSHAVPSSVASAFVYFISIGVLLGPLASMSGVHGIPTT